MASPIRLTFQLQLTGSIRDVAGVGRWIGLGRHWGQVRVLGRRWGQARVLGRRWGRARVVGMLLGISLGLRQE